MNTVLAGVTPIDPFARFKASMAMFSEERVSVAMAEIQDGYEKAVQRAGFEEESER